MKCPLNPSFQNAKQRKLHHNEPAAINDQQPLFLTEYYMSN